LERTPLLPIAKYLRDNQYPNDVVDCRHWNAYSIVVDDVPETTSKLKEVAGVGQYKQASKQFAAVVGSQTGLPKIADVASVQTSDECYIFRKTREPIE
jgi:hypothetical protein